MRSRSDPDGEDLRPPDCRARIERNETQPDVCTIFDTSVPRRLTTSWISAEEGSYVALDDVR
ncbi:hypothetical protein OB905_09130 [Halobacteria archaeon AArc-dxtr1]|nr:hypothetical protein [Halobacteria archaeon AArc-dxtr1]